MLEVKNISFSYKDSKAICNVNFSLAKGESVAIIGESGCGKSTLLQLIYGLHDLENGSISWNAEPVLGPKFNLIPGHKKMKYLAQDYDLMPYTTVAENVGTFLSNTNAYNKSNRILELLQLVEMTEFANIKVRFLSGGQKQRIALAKVLALEPELLLMDEPFSQIDTFRKNNLRRNLFAYFKQKQITCIIASHDSTDCLTFCDTTIALKNGMIIQQSASKEVYENPKNQYVANLFGDVNTIPVKQLIPFSNQETSVLLYGNELQVVEQSNLKVIVENNYFTGKNYLIEARIDSKTVYFENCVAIQPNEAVFLAADSLLVQERLKNSM